MIPKFVRNLVQSASRRLQLWELDSQARDAEMAFDAREISNRERIDRLAAIEVERKKLQGGQ